MNKTKFYDILQAHKRGEDLSKFSPTNAAEAELIATLQSGSSSSTGGDTTGGKIKLIDEGTITFTNSQNSRFVINAKLEVGKVYLFMVNQASFYRQAISMYCNDVIMIAYINKDNVKTIDALEVTESYDDPEKMECYISDFKYTPEFCKYRIYELPLSYDANATN